MPRYFFIGPIGAVMRTWRVLELLGLDEARYEAVVFAADTLKDDFYALWDGGEVRIEVMDSSHALIFTIVISAVQQASTRIG